MDDMGITSGICKGQEVKESVGFLLRPPRMQTKCILCGLIFSLHAFLGHNVVLDYKNRIFES